jgi:CRP-like cAMP-binding protein
MQTLGHAGQACESFRHALSQWRGPALTDLRKFEFAEQAARHLEEERLQAVESLMDAMLSDGAHVQVASELAGLVEEFPYRERLWELLMLSLYRSGRQTEALDAFKRIRSRLGEELGIDPWPALVDLEERILLHDPALSDFLPAKAELPLDVEYLDFRPGEVIVEQGSAASAIYWIEEGQVEVLKPGRGSPASVATLGPGQYFGELDVILGTARSSTVRALVPTTVSVYDVNSFRARMVFNETWPPPALEPADEIRDQISRGHYIQAYDIAAGHIEHGDTDPRIRYLAVLALARSGATTQARRRYDQYGLSTLDPSTLTVQLASDIAVLSARLDKDQALRGLGQREAWAKRSAQGYERAFNETGDSYHGVNTATMWLLAGERERAEVLAKTALTDMGSGDGYWAAATEAEAALIVGDLERARDALSRASGAEEGRLSQRATTLKQLKLVCRLNDIDQSILDPIRNPSVVHYAGHRILPSGDDDGAGGGHEGNIKQEMARLMDSIDAGVGFGSLAAGADIIAAETLLERGAELNVVLPFNQDEFVRTSVAPAGSDWVSRYERCIARATTMEMATSGEYLGDPVLFDFCAQVAMGEALIRADHLETDAHQIAVWDGGGPRGSAGTAVDVARWESTGAPSTVITVQAATQQEDPALHTEQRHIRAIVVAEVAGYSNLTDAQLRVFHETVSDELARRINPFRDRLLSGRTWGNGVRLIFEDVAVAAECALELMESAQAIDTTRPELIELRGLRIAAHAAPVFEGSDPIFGSDLVYGVGLTEAAVIEPRTPAGEIYATRAFAALAVLSESQSFECQYVGTTPTARRFGHMPLYVLRRRLPSGWL